MKAATTRPPILKTPAVADLLGVPYWLIHQLIRERRLAPPAKDSSDDYCWLPDDVERTVRPWPPVRARRRKGATA